MAPSSTSSCSPPEDHQYNLCSRRAKHSPKMVSVGQSSKRASRDQVVDGPLEKKRCSTGSSPHKRSRSPDVRAVVNMMKDFIRIQENRNRIRQSYLNRRQKAKEGKERKVLHVMELARECGASEATPLWLDVLKIIQQEHCVQEPSSTGSTPHKNSRNPAVRYLVNSMKDFIRIQEDRNHIMQSYLNRRQKARQKAKEDKEKKVLHVMELARECGASEATPLLWPGVLKIIQEEDAMAFFIGSSPKGRMVIIKHYAEEDVQAAATVSDSDDSSDDSEDESDELVWTLLDDDAGDFVFMCGMYVYAMHVDGYLQ